MTAIDLRVLQCCDQTTGRLFALVESIQHAISQANDDWTEHPIIWEGDVRAALCAAETRLVSMVPMLYFLTEQLANARAAYIKSCEALP